MSEGNAVKHNNKGFTLIELIVVISIIGILVAISVPGMMGWLQSATYRGAAQELNAALRDARSRAIATNREHRVVLFVEDGKQKFRLTEGNRAAGSSAWVDVSPPREVELPASVQLVPATTTLGFNPNGSSGSATISVRDSDGNEKFRVSLSPSGRVRIVKT